MILNLLISEAGRIHGWFKFKSFYFIKNRQKSDFNRDSHEKIILIYPSVKSGHSLTTLLIKINTAFPVRSGFKFFIKADAQLIKEAINAIQGVYANTNHSLELLNIEPLGPDNKVKLKEYSMILCHKTLPLIRLIRFWGKTEIIGSRFYSFIEGVSFQKSFFKLLSKEKKKCFARLSKANFIRLLKRMHGKTSATCLLTGPSINSYQDLNIPQNSIKIICNSLVKNNGLLAHIDGPDIITFADPVFHFGASEYAITFRECMFSQVRKYNSFVIVPDFTVPLLLAWFPQLNKNIIGLETLPDSFNLPNIENLWVKASDNILTMMMLPVAAALSDIILIAGADGRENKGNHFWKFEANSQFTDQMHTLFTMHPSFFRDRRYKQYYKDHCRNLEELLNWIEAKGKKTNSITPSLIPALIKRYKKST